MRQSILTRSDDNVGLYDSIAWAFEVHVKQPDTGAFHFAILHGNEDAPDKIEFWRENDPHYCAAPDYVWENAL